MACNLFVRRIVVCNRKKSKLIYDAYNNRDLLEFLLGTNVASMSVDFFIAMLATKFGVPVEVATAAFVISGDFKYTYDAINEYLFKQAFDITDSASKVRIDYTTMNGWPVNYYYEWTGNYVTDSPYQEFESTFHAGVYSP